MVPPKSAPASALARCLRSTPAILGLCAVILFLRKPDQFFIPQFWAEDGVFYHAWFIKHGAALIEPYAGYLHTLPRLIAATCWLVDPAYAPHWFVACAAAASLYVCTRALSPRLPLTGGPVLALAVVLVPDAFEVLLNVANLQWLVAAGFLLLLLSRDPTDLRSYAHDVIVAVLAGLTGPFSVLLAPLFFARAYLRRSRASWILAGLVALTAVVQLNFIRQYKEPPPPTPLINYGDGFNTIGTRLAGSLFSGGRITGESPLSTRGTLAVLTIALVIAIVIRRGRAERFETPLLLAAAFALLLAASLYRCRWVLTELQKPGFGSRYFFPLQLIFLWLIISNLADSKRAWRWSAIALLVVALAANFYRFRESPLVDLHWADYAPKIRAGEAVTIPINPSGWQIPLPAHPPQSAR